MLCFRPLSRIFLGDLTQAAINIANGSLTFPFPREDWGGANKRSKLTLAMGITRFRPLARIGGVLTAYLV